MMDYNTTDWPALPPLSSLINKVHCMDALEFLKILPSNSVDCCVTSPPYFGLRDYGVAGQIGLEPTPAAYVQTLVTLFRELRRVLKDSGTFWLNLGDSYVTSQKGSGGASNKQLSNAGSRYEMNRRLTYEMPEKNLLLIPHRVAIALQDDGWIVRQDNVWHKPNPMPESVTDRTTRAHEYVFQFAKSARYYYNAEAVKEPAQDWGTRDRSNGKYHNEGTGLQPHSGLKGIPKQDALGKRQYTGFNERYFAEAQPLTRNKRSVWTIPPAQFRESHFATFPRELPEICIKAGCPPGGLVLDMFMGSGTTADVARRLGCDYIGCELNANYMEINTRRLSVAYTPDMFMLAR